jgi:hypothetical protein
MHEVSKESRESVEMKISGLQDGELRG